MELSVENAEEVAKQIRHAGAIFMGRYTAEALGDYCARPNHDPLIFTKKHSLIAQFSGLFFYGFIRYSAERACAVKPSPCANVEATLPSSDAPSCEQAINDDRF